MPFELIVGVAIGALSWSFAEYALHHWLGHLGKGRNHFSREHLQHHAQAHYFAPSWQKFAAAAVVTIVLSPVLIVALGDRVGWALSLGFVAMYLVYESLHRRAHTHPPRGRYGAWLRKHHFSHHFNTPKYNHGVTSDLWDRVFGTYRPVGKVRVPRKKAMSWLLCPTSGELLPEYSGDYVIVGRADGQRERSP